jgi:hypothetical protein
MLGYSGVSRSCAFRRWTGSTPGGWRVRSASGSWTCHRLEEGRANGSGKEVSSTPE